MQPRCFSFDCYFMSVSFFLNTLFSYEIFQLGSRRNQKTQAYISYNQTYMFQICYMFKTFGI